MAGNPIHSGLPNPYDFSHPVTDPRYFSGRSKTIEDIRYYLDHAQLDPRPVNLALLGPRAAGKTSLLNMIALEADKRGYCVARVDLNEGDVDSDLSFFFKIFDAVFDAACGHRVTRDDADPHFAFEGREGKTYQTYIEMTGAYAIPSERKWRPFNFPLLYATAMGNNNRDALVRDPRFKDDLQMISQEVGVPIVILFDECNVLANRKVLLQKLRNVFMSVPGYMLVIAGTEEMFPVMDDVFSPVIRDFKRIAIERFASRDEARDCVMRPLRPLGIAHPDELFDPETLRDLIDPEGLAGGNPYQIQLICHFLFRNVQRGQATKMVLNTDVVENVLEELSQGADILHGPVITALRRLSSDQLRILGLLCLCNGLATLEQLWFVHHVAFGAPQTGRVELEKGLEEFQRSGLIRISDSKIKFAGDEREGLYAKYFAKKRGVELSVSGIPPDVALGLRLHQILARQRHVIPIGGITLDQPEDSARGKLAFRFMKCLTLGQRTGCDDLLASAPRDLIKDLYQEILTLAQKKQSRVDMISVEVKAPEIGCVILMLSQVSNENTNDKIKHKIAGLNERANAIGGELILTIEGYTIPPLEDLLQGLENSGNGRLSGILASVHFLAMMDAYLDGRNTVHALFHRDWCYRFVSAPPAAFLNNLGYMFIVDGSFEKARELLGRSLSLSKSLLDKALVAMNLGIVALQQGQQSEASEWFGKSVEWSRDLEAGDRQMACLFVPVVDGSSVRIEEWDHPDLLDCALAGQTAVDRLLTSADITR